MRCCTLCSGICLMPTFICCLCVLCIQKQFAQLIQSFVCVGVPFKSVAFRSIHTTHSDRWSLRL